MSSEGFQITIPTLPDDDDDFRSTPVPFGKPHNYGAFGQGRDSPTMAPLVLPERLERSYFHSREDSGQSFESEGSFKYATITNGKSFASAHSSQTSLVSTGITKKSSFASLRNAFKSSTKSEKADHVPPVPQLDTQALPGLSNPFSKSQGSLAYPAPPPNRRRPSTNASPPLIVSARPAPRGNHSFSGSSIFHNSDGDSGFGSPRVESPPPIPPIPIARARAPSAAVEQVENIPSEPRTPAEYALHAVFTRFVTAAEQKIELFLKNTKDREPSLIAVLGPDIDPGFDELLESFSKIAQKHAQALITSILRWRKSVGANAIKQQFVYEAPSHSRSLSRTPDVPAAERDRRSMAAIYIMCRALIVILRSVPNNALGQAMGTILEETTLEPFRRPNLKLLATSANHRANAELFGKLLGHVANLRFESVSDRFISELRPMLDGSLPKDSDLKLEVLVKGAKYLQLKVWPPEAFEEGADFLERFAHCFANAHGRLKPAFAESLVQLLHPIGKTAQAEVNHPVWAKAIDVIHTKAREMAGKPKYWHVAYPLAVSSLCVASHDYFLKNWTWCLDTSLTRLKERSQRTCALTGVVRLVWTYLFRCREPATTISMKLEPVMKSFFPPNRGSVIPPDEPTTALILLVHFIIMRQFEFGVELTTYLIQEKAIIDMTVNKQWNPETFFPDRMVIAIKAILLSLTAMEKEQKTPTWPSSSSYASYDTLEPDYPSAADNLSDQFLMNRPPVHEFFAQFAPWVYWITRLAGQAAGSMSVIDERWTPSGLSDAQDEPTALIIHRLPMGNVAYPRNMVPWVELLQACYESWPRCLDKTMLPSDCVDIMIRGVIHVEPSVSEAAAAAMTRYCLDVPNTRVSVARLTHFLFSPRSLAREGSNYRLTLDCSKLLELWASTCERLSALNSKVEDKDDAVGSDPDDGTLLDEVQAASLFLLATDSPNSRRLGLKVLTCTERLVEVGGAEDMNLIPLPAFLAKPTNWVDHVIRHTRFLDLSILGTLKASLTNLNFQQLLDEASGDSILWGAVRPAFFRVVMEFYPRIASLCRDSVQAAVLRYHPAMSNLAEISGKGPLAPSIRSNPQPRELRDLTEYHDYISRWAIWVQILCSTALPSEVKSNAPRGHTRIPSDLNSSKDRISSARGLFRHLIPFLSSDHLVFREAVVAALGSIDRSSYQGLLEDLQAVTRHVYDARAVRTRRQDRLYTSVVEIFRRTSPFLKELRASPDTTSLHLVLQFVRESSAFLGGPDARTDWELQPLRRHFCGIVTNLFVGLSAFKDSDRFISPNARLKLFRLCEEWCLLGRQSETVEKHQFEMQSTVAKLYRNAQIRERANHLFETESNALSNVAAMALCALCEGAFFSSSVESPTGEVLAPLQVTSVLDRLNAMLSSPDNMIVESARSALHDLLVHRTSHTELYEQVLQCCILTPSANKARIRCFEVVTKIIVCEGGKHHFTIAQSILLALMNITHAQHECRKNALKILQCISVSWGGLPDLALFEAAVESQAASVLLHTRHRLTEILSIKHRTLTAEILMQASKLLLSDSENKPLDPHNAVRNTLQFLEPWLSHIEFVPDGQSHFSVDGYSIMRSLTGLTARFLPEFPDHFQALWSCLAHESNPMNSTSIVSFLMEQASKRGDALFASCAADIIACLSRTACARRIVEDLCSFIEPQDMVPIRSDQAGDQTQEYFQWDGELGFISRESNKDQSSLSLAPAQLAWILLSDVALDQAWELIYQIPSIIHSLFIHTDSSISFIKERSRKMLFQTLRAWLPGLDAQHSQNLSTAAGKEMLDQLTDSLDRLFWNDDDPDDVIIQKSSALANNVLKLLEPLILSLRQEWAAVALDWGTSCPVRAVASKSLKVFRVLYPEIDKPLVASLLGRLSNTISDEDNGVQIFGAELILTLETIVSSERLSHSLLPLLFWSAAACLLTTNECEYIAALDLLNILLDKLDLNDLSVVDSLLANKPTWIGPEFSIQDLLLQGLRSSRTSGKTIAILCRLTAIELPDLLDPDGTRVRDLYTISLVLFLDSIDHGAPSAEHSKLANDLARLADVAGLTGISRILVSFSRGRFRTKEDFARQAIASLRDQFAGRHWNSVVILLLSMVLNEQRWMREKSMAVLKVFFQHRDARHPSDPLSAELLMPLLRLLHTDLAPQALEVLDVHMPMSNDEGLAAKDVLRMSMHDLAKVPAPSAGTHVFGIPSESGWSVGDPFTSRSICRQNAINVFESCRTAARPSMIQFQPEIQVFSGPALDVDVPEQQSLCDLVSTLHDINSFFQNPSSTDTHSPSYFIEAETRVAEILGRSMNQTALDLSDPSEYDARAVLPTPFVGAFSVSHTENGEMTPNSFDFAGNSSGSDHDDDDKFTFEKFVSKSSGLRSPSNFLRRAR